MYKLAHVLDEENELADALSRAPIALSSPEWEAPSMHDFNPSLSASSYRFDSMRVVGEGVERREIFDRCHNSTSRGTAGYIRKVNEVRQLGHEWPLMSRDITSWVIECPPCQKIRGKSDTTAVPSQNGSICIFEELSIDFQGPFPTDDVGNSYVCGAVCNTVRYCELFAVTEVIAAHCLLSVVARYGCFRSLRSDRGTNFVNEMISEFLRLFEIQSVLTLAYRPQANAIVERNRGEVVRHLRALVGSITTTCHAQN